MNTKHLHRQREIVRFATRSLSRRKPQEEKTAALNDSELILGSGV